MTAATHCQSCGVAWAYHLGISGTCAQVKQLRQRMDTAHAAMLRIWPDGAKCLHGSAREAFAALEVKS